MPRSNREVVARDDENNYAYLELDGDEMLVFCVTGYRHNFTTRTLSCDEKTKIWLGGVVYRHLQDAAKHGRLDLAKQMKSLQDEADKLIRNF